MIFLLKRQLFPSNTTPLEWAILRNLYIEIITVSDTELVVTGISEEAIGDIKTVHSSYTESSNTWKCNSYQIDDISRDERPL